jgi:hypothetical protein
LLINECARFSRPRPQKKSKGNWAKRMETVASAWNEAWKFPLQRNMREKLLCLLKLQDSSHSGTPKKTKKKNPTRPSETYNNRQEY